MKELLVTVDIGKNPVQQPGALGKSSLQPLPFVEVQHEGNRLEICRPERPHGIIVDMVGDTVFTDQSGRFVTAGLKLAFIHFGKRFGQLPPMWARLVVRADEFIEDLSGARVTAQYFLTFRCHCLRTEIC